MNRVAPQAAPDVQASKTGADNASTSTTAAEMSPSSSSRKCLLASENCCSCTTNQSAVFSTFCPCAISSSSDSALREESSSAASTTSSSNQKSKIFPSTRFFIAILLCFCFVALSMSTSNISVSMVSHCNMISNPTAHISPSDPVDMIKSNEGSLTTSSPEDDDDDNYQQSSTHALKFTDYTDFSSDQKLSKAHILRLKRSLSTANNTSVFIEEILHVLEKMGVENATFQFHKENNSSDKANAHHISECQLARFRKHASDELSSAAKVHSLKIENGRIVTDKDASDKNRGLTVLIERCDAGTLLDWSSFGQGVVYAGQNAGSLLMLITGTQADRLNSKWTIVIALLLLVLSNVLLPIVAPISIVYAILARVLTGFADALLQPSTSCLLRWFPPKERSFAIGFITGGRQIGTLLILPVAGILCARPDILGGWPAIFYLSAAIGSLILIAWLLMSADKPSKHYCTSLTERYFIEQKIAEEQLGKRKLRKAVPWRQIITCRPLYIGVAALICHEYPLVIMLQLLPKYVNDVLNLTTFVNGFVSALPIAVLFISKTLSSSLSSVIGARKKGRFLIERTPLVKLFNGTASLGLGICLGILPWFQDHVVVAIAILCLANAFAGLHTPGVQTALLQLAPAYTGIVTGIAFGFVAIFGILNKIMSLFILKSSSNDEWSTVLWIAAVVALLPVFFFSLWGSADRQSWATNFANSNAESETTQKVDHVCCGRIFTAPNSGAIGSTAGIDSDFAFNSERMGVQKTGDLEGQSGDAQDNNDTTSMADTFATALQFQLLDSSAIEEEKAEKCPTTTIPSDRDKF